MSRSMAPADWRARGEAYTQAARQLTRSWTSDRKEIEQGEIVQRLLEREASKCHRIADDADKLGSQHRASHSEGAR